ncbi:MAG: DNA polymerase III subunit alpha, partial [Alphaproteobacteria bacterium]|nr:DNA polymerase III subunit alpha [Alphaproteobacteria bacterium]
AAKKGVQPIVGCLLPIRGEDERLGNGKPVGPSWVPVYAQNENGYLNLLKLLSLAHLETDAGLAPEVGLDDVIRHQADLILLSGGPEGPIGRALLHGNREQAQALIEALAPVFEGRFYIELMRHGLDHEDQIEPAMIELAYINDLPLVATNDVHFLETEEHQAHDVLLCIEQGVQVGVRERRRVTPEHRLKTPAEMAELFADLPEAVANSVVIARRCAFMVGAHDPILPAFDTAGGRDEAAELRAQAEAGLEQRMDALEKSEEERAVYRERLAYEVGVILRMKYEGYFLIVSDFIKYAKSKGIPVGPGRGSGAGSVVAWSLEITDLDPLRFGLLFERFLNPERVSMPDFDIDFCQDRRDDVIRYVREKYGAEKVAAIITFGKLQARAVLRDTGRALGLPFFQVDKVAKLVPFNPANPPTLEEALLLEPRLKEVADEDEQVGELIDIAKQLEGLPRHASTHAAGVVIGDRALDELVPLYRDPRASMPVTQFNMKDVEKAGLVKFDFLGLTTLTMLTLGQRLVNSRGTQLELAKLPLDDEASYQLLARGETVGVFQLESSGMRDALRKLLPDCFEDIIAMVSLYRPGPMDNIPRYINVKHGREDPEYLHPMLQPILSETNGVIIYQEQVMRIAQDLAGYSLGGADLLRRAMGKKIKAEMDAQREVFIDGAVKNGISKKLATTIFDQVAKFASYGFNKSHAAAYALLAYHTAYLKANHAVEFYAASMTMDRGNQDKLNLFRQELLKVGIPLLPPDVNRSCATFVVEDPSAENGQEKAGIRYSLAAIKGVGVHAVDLLTAERDANGPFEDMFELTARLGPGVLSRRLLEAMIKAGALDAFDDNRLRLISAIDAALRYGAAHAEEEASTQESLFGAGLGSENLPKPKLPEVDDLPVLERLQQEFGVLGFYLSAHPLDGYRSSLARMDVVAADQLIHHGGRRVKLAGTVLGKQERATARSRFAFVQLSDPTGTYEITLFSELLGRARDLIEGDQPLLVEGEVRLDGDIVKVLASSIEALDQAVSKGKAKSAAGRVAIRLADAAAADKVSRLLGPHGDGSASVHLVLALDDAEEVTIDLGERHRLALGRRIDLERQTGVLSVSDC